MPWQKEFTLSKHSKGCHLVTDEIVSNIRLGLKDVKIGILYLFIQHTSCGLTINENFDPDVRHDMDMALDNVVPEELNWQHQDEGPEWVVPNASSVLPLLMKWGSDSVSHTKAALIGTSVQVPITDGRLNLGTWQGIYLTEFRHLPHVRRLVATIL